MFHRKSSIQRELNNKILINKSQIQNELIKKIANQDININHLLKLLAVSTENPLN